MATSTTIAAPEETPVGEPVLTLGKHVPNLVMVWDSESTKKPEFRVQLEIELDPATARAVHKALWPKQGRTVQSLEDAQKLVCDKIPAVASDTFKKIVVAAFADQPEHRHKAGVSKQADGPVLTLGKHVPNLVMVWDSESAKKPEFRIQLEVELDLKTAHAIHKELWPEPGRTLQSLEKARELVRGKIPAVASDTFKKTVMAAFDDQPEHRLRRR